MDIILRYKKIIIAAGFTLTVFLLGYGIYFLFFKPLTEKQPLPDEEVPVFPIGGLPEAETGDPIIIDPADRLPLPFEPDREAVSPIAIGGITQVTELSPTQALDPGLHLDGTSLRYYDRNDGRFYRIDQNGMASPLSDRIFHSVKNVFWNNTQNSAIIEYPDGVKIHYDFTANKQVTLPQHWKEFNFSPQGNQMVMKSIGLDPNNRWLAISTPDGSQARIIEAIGTRDSSVYPAWSPNNQIIAMYTESLDFNRQEVFFIGQNNENFKSMVVEGRGFEPKWSPVNNQLLYSVYSSQTDMKPNLWLVNASGEEIGMGRKDLKLETWANKCVFANEIDIYCAVPERLEVGAGLFPELAQNTRDNLYRINAATGLKQLIAIPDGVYNMSNLAVSKDGYYLFFLDEITRRINKIILK